MFSYSSHRFHSLFVLPGLLPLIFFFAGGARNNGTPPVAVDDSYAVHACAIPLRPDLTANDSNPDGNPITITAFPQSPAHGQLSRGAGNTVSYCPSYGYVGADSFTY